MTKFAFQFPAKFVFTESKVEPRKVESEFPLYSFDNQNVYFCTKKEKVVHATAEFNSYFLFINNHLFFFRTDGDDESAILRLNDLGERYDAAFKKYSDYVDDPSIYEREQAANRERWRQEKEARDKEQQEQKERRAKTAREAYLNALDKFKEGGYISWQTFEDACKENDLNIPIKTIGFGRKYVVEVSLNSYRTYGKKKSTVLYSYIDGLKNALTNQTA